jgi:3-phosphoshikimate 1-carboxyvinyltransferase
MDLLVEKSSGLSGSVTVPSSKSQTLRSIIFASLAGGRSEIINPLFSPDAIACARACEMMGAKCDLSDSGNWAVEGTGGELRVPNDVINAGNSGIILRFLAGVAANVPGWTVFTGDESIRKIRPMQPVIDGINQLGGQAFSTKGDGRAPVAIRGRIKGGRARISGEDSQFVSSLLIASSACEGDSELVVDNAGEKPWVGLTLSWFDFLGINYREENKERYWIEGGKKLKAFKKRVQSDWSTAAFPIAAGVLCENSRVVLDGMDFSDPQGDKEIVNVLKKMGAKVTVDRDRVTAETSELRGIEIDANDTIDAIPILSVIGCAAEGETRIFNGEIARRKESDRISAMATELGKMGAKIRETQDGLVVGKSELKGAVVDAHEDHRIALSLAIAGMMASGKTVVKGVDKISKTFAEFPEKMKKLGAVITES